MSTRAKFVKEIVVEDPDTGNLIEMEVYKHENGGMFAIDSSYLDHKFDDGEGRVPDPFGDTTDDGLNDLVILEEK